MFSRLTLALITLLTFSAPAQVVEVCRLTSPPPAWSLACTPSPSIQKKKFDTITITVPSPAAANLCGKGLPVVQPVVPLDLASLAKLVTGSQFTVSVSGSDTVVVSQTTPATPKSKPITSADLKNLNAQMELLLNTVPPVQAAFSIELTVPHAASLPAYASLMGSISSGKFTATASGKNRVLISTPSGLPPSCADWQAFQKDARDLAWSTRASEPEARLISLDASATATALGSSAAGGGTATPSGGAASPGSSAAAAGSGSASATPSAPALTITVTPPPAATGSSAAPATGAGAPSTATTISVAAAPATATPAAAAAPAAAAPAAVASTPAAGVSTGAIPPDTLVFAATNPGDDAAVVEKQRIIAKLNLPRSEMSISAWSIQNSSTDPRSVSESSRLVREEVAAYNDGLERTISFSWDYLKGVIADASKPYFNDAFYNYIAQRVVFEGASVVEASTQEQSASAVLQDHVTHSEELNGHFIDTASKPAHAGTFTRGDYLGLCPPTEYCLGYTTLFHPVQPRLMDLLLALIAANNPQEAAKCAVSASETMKESPDCNYQNPGPPDCNKQSPSSIKCEVWKQLFPMKDGPLNASCETLDYQGVLQSLDNPAGPVMFLNCFRSKADLIFRPTTNDSATYLDVLRAAIADFLFNYKLSLQYPHEFVPYDLTTSAQAMNSALRPLIDAFLRDVEAYQAVLKRKLAVEIDAMNKQLTEHSRGDKPRYFENSIVTIHTIAGSEGSVDTSTESYLDEANAPTLSALSNAVLGGPGTATAAGGTGISGLLAGARLNEAQAIAAGLGQFASSRIHLGRELSVDVKPVTLPGASSAELQVTLKADDEAGSGTYSSGATGDAELSRFSKSDTTTRVRVDSLKLFEVSSFASQLSTPKKRFPLLPPFVELPYIGSLVSFPLAPSREYHASIVVMSAVVIPTAADLAFTARFVADQMLGGDDPENRCIWPGDDPGKQQRKYCRTRTMVSLDDFAGQPVREFNRMKTHCLATNGKSATPSLVPLADLANQNVCGHLAFNDVIGEVLQQP